MWAFVLRNESTKFWLYVQAMEFLTLKVVKPRPTSVVRGGITNTQKAFYQKKSFWH